MKKITIGIVAHVDGGKTTLSEALLYTTGKIRKLGRVDHKDAYLDTFQMERDRGITIFSKQAVMEYNDMRLILLDTPGHVDFSAEMERTLSVLDYAVLVVSGSEGVQGHTETLWKLLETYHVPTFLFVNKMDMPNVSGDFLLHEIKEKLSDSVVRFPAGVGTMEDIAMCDEDLFETYMEGGEISDTTISELIYNRNLFPCYFGSALQLDGVDSLLEGLYQYTYESIYSENFGAKVFKISKDHNNNRLTHLKITGGSLKEKDILSGMNGAIEWSEKVNEIRVYSGEKYDAVGEVKAGDVCAIIGLTNTYQGEGLGFETEEISPSLIPVLSYKLDVQNKVHMNQVYQQLKELEEEDPTLKITWNEEKKELTTSVMGQVQIEVLKSLIKERFDLDVEFGAGSILYKETITNTVEGVGHFEPLRHYAEVHLLLEPGMPGSGLTFESHVSENELSKNWQRLIMTHLEEKTHRGVLTGAPITDICITIVGGNAHLKHTEGGDFRQATYRAVRQGLQKAENVLLEPYYSFRIELPTENLGRAMTDIQKMYGSFDTPQSEGDISIITGKAPVSTMYDYTKELISYTRGKGKLFCETAGYEECHNTDEVIERIGYDSEADLENPAGSVFCAHGAGFQVKWNEVEQYMHLHPDSSVITKEKAPDNKIESLDKEERKKKLEDSRALDKELEEIFVKTFGPVKRRLNTDNDRLGYEKKTKPEKPYIPKWENKKPVKNYLLVDGYNLLFSWEELNELSKVNLDAARTKLMDILCNYQGYKKTEVILVFDAYKVKGNTGEVAEYHNIHVVYTKEAQTADAYIEKTTHELSKKHNVTVVTSDALEQLIIMGQGAIRVSSREFKLEIEAMEKEIRENWLGE